MFNLAAWFSAQTQTMQFAWMFLFAIIFITALIVFKGVIEIIAGAIVAAVGKRKEEPKTWRDRK